jgi:hypothetical protein
VAASAPTAVAGNASKEPDVQATINSFEVTSDVQAWVNGSRTNYGWAILPWDTGNNGWGSRSSEWSNFVYPDEPNRERPRLRVFYTLNTDVVGAPTIHTLAFSANQIVVPFRGTIGRTYSVMRAPAPSGPWSNVGSATVDANGNASFTDTLPLPGQGYYRIVYP